MPLLTHALGLLRRTPAPHAMRKAGITSKPAKDPITPAQQAIALSVMFVTFLIPFGWTLSHIENYKHRS
ncbi:hypothetical protein FKM82_031258 [Ascaphus truei]